MSLKETWGKRVLCLDGAMGTMIQAKDIAFTTAPEYLNITHPHIIEEIHSAYIEAGADIIETNTFGGNRIKLSNYGLEREVAKVNKAGVEIAKKMKGNQALVAASMGPTGKFLEPVGDLSFAEAVDVFREQALAFKEGGADLVMVETMSDLKEAKAAVIAIREYTDLPVFVLATFQEDLFTLLGISPESAGVTMEALDVEAIGANCSLGPQGILQVAKRMASVTGKPLVFMPNAGIPQLVDGNTIFPSTPEEMGEYASKFVELGAWVVGGCCGSTPEHIKEMAKRVKGLPPVKRTEREELKLAGKREVVFIGGKNYPVVIGERINPTGKEDFQRELRAGKVSWAIKTAVSQVKAGAQLLDVNVGIGGLDEKKFLPFIATAVQTQVGVPLVLDSSDPEAIEACLQRVEGKPLINSVSGEVKSLEVFLPLAKRYGASLLILPLDEKGIPDTPKGRVEVAKRVVQRAKGMGLSVKDLIVDGLTMAVSADVDGPRITLETVRLIKEELGLPTVLGVSNISFGLPSRDLLNSAFLVMALEAGLDVAMINPNSERMMDFFHAGALLSGRDLRAQRFLDIFSGKKQREEGKRGPISAEEALFQAVIMGDEASAVHWASELLKMKAPLVISNEVLIPAMEEVGERFERNEYFLPQVMASAQAMQRAFSVLKEVMRAEEEVSKGTIVMATVEGDIHDIGKNIVCTLLENHGFKVVDLGKNVPTQRILDATKNCEADAVGLSALMTTTMGEMERVIQLLKREGLRVVTIVGGAVITPEYARKIGATAYAKDAIEAVKILERVIEGKESC